MSAVVLSFFTFFVIAFAAGVVTLDTYNESNENDDQLMATAGVIRVAQSWTNDNATNLDSAAFWVKKSGTPTGTMVATVHSHTGTYGTSSEANALLATSDTVSISGLTTSFALVTFNFTGADRIALSASTQYVVSLDYSGASGVRPAIDSSSPAADGNYSQYTAAWATNSGEDVIFYVYGKTAEAVPNKVFLTI